MGLTILGIDRGTYSVKRAAMTRAGESRLCYPAIGQDSPDVYMRLKKR